MTERELFEAALELPPEDRAAYLDRVCGTDGELRQRLGGLLRKHDRAGSFLEAAPPELAPTINEPAIERPGTEVGPYKLLEQIGEGGFGIVFMADQHAPVRRRVALKIIKPGMDTRQVLARFEVERQALALMDHPNIARAFDAGATDSGRPYFVMELVRGVPITDYCDQTNLAVHERLELFVQVCRAVQHAHQKGIIHRDLKPSNILVTLLDGRPVPKVIDFGIAKAINQPLTEETLFTRFSEMIGTPHYMSPEQAEMTGLDIDTRSDIYSLGVLLYELLTGSTPFDKNRLKREADDEIRRIIREEEPPRPSLRISTLGEKRTVVAAHRHADPNRLSQLLRGDLDWIVMKALEKERSRRYETANGFAMDVERHLADEPVLACPPSAAYRFAKFARRNRVAFTTAMAVLTAILLGTAVSVTEAIRATRAERLAESRLQAETAARAEAEGARQSEAEQRQIADSRRREAEAQKVKAVAAATAERAANERAQQIEQKRQAENAASLVDELTKAQMGEVPGIVHQIEKIRPLTDPLLRHEDAGAQEKSDKKLRLGLALLHVDRSKIDDLRDGLLRVSPAEFVVLRDALLPYKNSVIESLWKAALDPHREPHSQFQAACALATYTPDDQRWSRINTFVAGHLVTLETSALVAWREVVRPAKGQLIKPLASIYRNTTQEQQSRIYATETLADYAADRPAELFGLLADAERFQFPVIFGKFAADKDQAVALAARELARMPPAKASEDDKERLAKRQANAAVALLRLATPERVWPLLKFSPDPSARSYLIHWAGPSGGDPQQIVDRLDSEADVTARRALVLMLGEFTEAQLSTARRQPLIKKLLAVCENEPDAGLHGAAEWLLRKWGQGNHLDARIDKLKVDEKQLQHRKMSDRRQWYVNTQRQTFVVLDASEFLMGSPESEPDRHSDESRHLRQIRRRFAISAYEVTKAQYQTFERAAFAGSLANYQNYSVRTDDSPQTSINWFEAARYCNWLSEQEGIPSEQWCFEPNDRGVYGPGMRAKESYLELTGYRLPTEAEWEYACRAGTVTSRYYGHSEGLLPKYAWYVANSKNRTWPVGSLKPNDWGMFDMEGNAMEWCLNLAVTHYPQQTAKVVDSVPSAQPITANISRVMRGATFSDLPSIVRSAYRSSFPAFYRSDHVGFRPARTLP